MEIRAFTIEDEQSVIDLWRRCGLVRPWNDPRKDIQRKLTTQADLFFVGHLAGEIIASIMAGFDGHRGWVNYLAVAPERRRSGFGRMLMAHVETALQARGCPKLNLQVRSTNHPVLEFYRHIGYAEDEVVSFGKRLIADN